VDDSYVFQALFARLFSEQTLLLAEAFELSWCRLCNATMRVANTLIWHLYPLFFGNFFKIDFIILLFNIKLIKN
jgi:hypothetical protein